ncbi:MAG: hypothetical protein K2O29_00310 [Ruminococcus sp.]|nr:hypothetical protein [Ruminococcus sp.]
MADKIILILLNIFMIIYIHICCISKKYPNDNYFRVPKFLYFMIHPHIHNGFDLSDNRRITLYELLCFIFIIIPNNITCVAEIILIICDGPLHTVLIKNTTTYVILSTLTARILKEIINELKGSR